MFRDVAYSLQLPYQTMKGAVMKVLTSKKAIIIALSLGSVVLAGTIKDIIARTVSKAHQ